MRPRRTKIVGTIGPASNKPEVLEGLMRAGLDVTRLNFSHGTHDAHRAVYAMVREASAAVAKPIAVLQDLQGPKIRLGKLDGVVALPEGEEVVLSSEGNFLGTRDRLPTTYERLADDVKVGEPMLLADGALELVAVRIQGADVVAKILVGGTLTSNKGLNLPRSTLSIPSLVDKDREDLALGLELGVDYVALSFVRVPHDVIVVRELMEKLGRKVPIISKIEKPQAVQRLEAILDVSDGIMIARGDLGVELPAEQVPTVQRRAIRLARARGKQTIVATQMLVSMTKNLRPTHAEVSDVANAVFDGTDAVMLSEETAAGAYPIRAVETMAAIAENAESAAVHHEVVDLVPALKKSYAGATSRAAVLTAGEMSASAIVSYTHNGLGPRLIADWRPPCHIIGFAPSEAAARRMALFWGVRPFAAPAPTSFEDLVATFERVNDVHHIAPKGSTVVITSKIPFVEGQLTNMIKLHEVGSARDAVMSSAGMDEHS